MSRVFKGSKFKIKLYIPDCNDANEINGLSISLYTNDPDISADFIDGFNILGNIVEMVVPSNALCNLEDGILNYAIQGFKGENSFVIERQSNYVLKSPSSEYGGTSLTSIEVDFVGNEDNIMVITPDDYSVDGFSKVVVNATDFGDKKYDEGYNQGVADNSGEEIEITDNGTYRGLFNKVTVSIEKKNPNTDIYENPNYGFIAIYEGYWNEINAKIESRVMEMEKYTQSTNGLITERIAEKIYSYGTYIPLCLDFSLGNLTHLDGLGLEGFPISMIGIGCWNVVTVSKISDWNNGAPIIYLAGLGTSFETEQEFEVNPTYPSGWYSDVDVPMECIKCLYDFSKSPNKNGVTTSTLILHKNTRADIKAKAIEMGWKVVEKE